MTHRRRVLEEVLFCPSSPLDAFVPQDAGFLRKEVSEERELVCLQTGTSRWSVAGRFVVLFSPEFHCEPVQSWVRL